VKDFKNLSRSQMPDFQRITQRKNQQMKDASKALIIQQL